MNYRKFYKENVCDIPKGFHVHHIDLNRENNKLTNLVMLPKDLHQEYHRLIIELNENIKINFKLAGVIVGGSAHNYYLLNLLNEKEDIRVKCNEWVDYRDYKLGYIPDIHRKDEIIN